jgi:pSer/pThr/pTyr-binding forkhead associated (FHA) protein
MLNRVTQVADVYPVDALFGAITGVCIGLALGVAEGVILRSLTRAGRGALIGGLAGLLGGAIGLVIGEAVYQPLHFLCFIGRSLGWGVFGVTLGLAEGITRRSWRGTRSAALGGAIGGAVGGFAFDLIGFTLGLITGSALLSRMVALIILGACIGLFIVVLERALADGWLKVVSGRFEGREFFLDKPLLSLGSDERADVPLFGDPQIQRRHAAIRQEQGEYVIEPNPGAPLQVNKQLVGRHALRHGDTLMVGNTRLLYRSRKVAAQEMGIGAQPSGSRDVPVPPPAVLQPSLPPLPSQAPMALVNLRTGQRYPLQAGGIVTLGRHPQNSILLDDTAVSGFHAELRFENGRWVLYDHGSTNGTFVNERRIAGPNMLKPGFQVRCGDTTLRVE